MTFLFWFVAGAVLIICELLTTSLIFASFAFGAVVAGLVGALGSDLVGQGLAFAAASVLGVFLLKPILSKRFTTKNSQSSTNVMALIGMQGLVVEEVSQTSGLVKIRGEVWSAKALSGEIASNTSVEITDIDGAALIVKSNTSA